jgi:folylpolyglutamate synthase/dihydropteroate synthase
LVVGLMREKEPHEMLDALGVLDAARLVCCRPQSPRGHDPEVVAEAAFDLGVDRASVTVIDDVHEAVVFAVDTAGADGEVVITGSLYVVSPARAQLVR